MLVIGVCSPEPGCGKDSFVGINKLHRFAFADILKLMAVKLGWDGLKDKKGRAFLIDLGSTVRKYNPDFLVENTINELNDYNFLKNGITDLRFYNEWERLYKCFPNNLIVVGIERETNSGFKDDISQVDYYKIPKDFIINNDGDLESFEEKCKEVYNVIRNNYIKLLQGNG